MNFRYVGAVMTMAVVMILLAGVSLAQTWKDVDIKNPDGSYVYSPDTRAAMKAVDLSRVMPRCSEIISSNPGGDAYFCPGEFVFREDMAVYLLRARRGANYIPATPPLPPMPPQVQDTLAYYSMAPWIYELVSEGISNPSTCGVNTFCPSRPITRAEAIELMVKTYNARQCQASKVPPEPGQNVYVFSDVPGTSSAAKWINAACTSSLGILTGCSSSVPFYPNRPLTRADAALWINRIFTGSVAEACQLLKVTKTGSDGTGRVTSNPSGVDCGSFCDVNFAKNTVVTLTATADSGSKFTGWSGANCTGHERDFHANNSEIDTFDYMHARTYWAIQSKFVSVDPGNDYDETTPQSWNLYTFVRNNPIVKSDKDGKAVIEAPKRKFEIRDGRLCVVTTTQEDRKTFGLELSASLMPGGIALTSIKVAETAAVMAAPRALSFAGKMLIRAEEALGKYPMKIGGGGRLQPYSKLTGQYVAWANTGEGRAASLMTSNAAQFSLGFSEGFIQGSVTGAEFPPAISRVAQVGQKVGKVVGSIYNLWEFFK